MNTNVMNDPMLPLCDGAPLLDAETDVEHGLVKRAFLLAYREINRCARELRRVRAATPINAVDERRALQAMECALLARNALENEHSRIGIVATPVVDDGLVSNVAFTAPAACVEEPSEICISFALMTPSTDEQRATNAPGYP